MRSQFDLNDPDNPTTDMMRKAIRDCCRNLAHGAETHMRQQLIDWCYANVSEWVELVGQDIELEAERDIREEIGESLDFWIEKWRKEADNV